MTDAGPRRWLRWGPAVAVVVAVTAGALAGRVAGPAGKDDDPEGQTVHATSDAPRLGSLDELVAASDLIVRAQVGTTERGRVFGDPGGSAAIESRVVTLDVRRVLRGDAAAPQLLVEEEGWTADGAPLVVDGARPSAPGDDAIWFLTRVGVAEEERFVVVSAQGRYLVERGVLVGAAGDDPLVAELVALGPSGLEAAVVAVPPPGP